MIKPIIYWIRRDFRLDNNPALKFVIDSKQPVIPVFIKDGALRLSFVHYTKREEVKAVVQALDEVL